MAEAARSTGPPAPARVAPLAATDWCDTADDWGTEGDGWGGERNSEVQEEETAAETEGRDDPKGMEAGKQLSPGTDSVSCHYIPSVFTPSADPAPSKAACYL